MFETHFAKQRPKPRYAEDKGELLTQLESVLYNEAQWNILFTKENLFKNMYNPPAKTILEDALAGLVKKGYLKEIHGVRIERMISSI